MGNEGDKVKKRKRRENETVQDNGEGKTREQRK